MFMSFEIRGLYMCEISLRQSDIIIINGIRIVHKSERCAHAQNIIFWQRPSYEVKNLCFQIDWSCRVSSLSSLMASSAATSFLGDHWCLVLAAIIRNMHINNTNKFCPSFVSSTLLESTATT